MRSFAATRPLRSRLLTGLLVMLGVVTAVFGLFQGIGDPARLVMGQTGDAATLQNIRRELHLDEPVLSQFLRYVNDMSPLAVHHRDEIDAKGLRGIFVGGDLRLGLKLPYLRRSYQSRKPVWDILSEALIGTALLAVTAMLVAIGLGVPFGVWAAMHRHGWQDRSLVLLSVAGISAPSFFVGMIIAYLFGFQWSSITGLHMTGSLYEVDPFAGPIPSPRNLILPAVTLGIRPLAVITQLTRSAMLDTLGQDLVRTARAKGLPERRVIWRHALPNAWNPVMTSITGWFAELLSGAFFVEYIFGWKGIGKVTVDALEKLDTPSSWAASWSPPRSSSPSTSPPTCSRPAQTPASASDEGAGTRLIFLADACEGRTLMESVPPMRNVADIFRRKGFSNITVEPSSSVRDALRIMAEKNIGSVVVMSGERYMGLFTERDYARKVILQGKSSSEIAVSEIMSEHLPVVSSAHSLEDCMEIMTRHNIRYLPVFQGDDYLGIISIIDVVKETILAQQDRIEHLQNYINGSF